jgi:Holliday junction resolvase
MDINHYRAGRDAEHELRDILRSHGHIVVRSAGSAGEADLVSIDPTGAGILWECKCCKDQPSFSIGSKYLKEQFNSYLLLSQRVRVIYAIRFSSQEGFGPRDIEWRTFELDPLGTVTPFRRMEGTVLMENDDVRVED